MKLHGRKQVVVGVAGCGGWGSKHLRVLAGLAGVEVVAIDPDVARARASAAAVGGVEAAAGLQDCIDRLDALVVATPATAHFEVAMAALERRVPVLVEKPCTMQSALTTRLADVAEENGVVALVGHTFLYSAAVQLMARRIAAGDIGTVRTARSVRANMTPVHGDIDVVWDLAPHDLSILRLLFGRHPRTVSSAVSHRAGHRAVAACLELDYGGMSARVELSWVAPRRVRRLHVIGDDATLVHDLSWTRDVVRLSPRSLDRRHARGPLGCGREPLLVQAETFVNAVRGDTRALVPGTAIRDAAALAVVVEAAQRSIGEQRPCAVDQAPVRTVDRPAVR